MTDPVKFLREAGRIRRCHSLPVVFGEYNIAHHVYGVMTIILTCHPAPSTALLRAALVHDAAERVVGDVPAPVKWLNSDLARDFRDLERRVLRKNLPGEIKLDAEDERWLASADTLDLWLWAGEQVMMGNACAADVMRNLEDYWMEKPLVPELQLVRTSYTFTSLTYRELLP